MEEDEKNKKALVFLTVSVFFRFSFSPFTLFAFAPQSYPVCT